MLIDTHIIYAFICLQNQLQIFQGNSDRNTLVTSLFASEVRAILVRILPTEWQGSHPNMRFEILGCQGKYSVVNVNHSMFASSWIVIDCKN